MTLDNFLSEMEENMTRHARLYEDISEKWRTFSNVLGTTISEYMKEDREGAEELHNLWKNYQIKMSARIQKAHEAWAERYKEMAKIWGEHRVRLASVIDNNVPEVGLNEELYMTWTDLSTSMTKHVNEAVVGCSNEYKELTKTWFEFLDKVKMGISSLEQSRGQEVVRNVREMCTAMSYELSNYIKACTRSTANFQKDWMNMLVSTRTIFSKLFPEVNYEELYSGFLDRGPWGPYSTLVAPTKVKKLEEEVKELRTKLRDLEEKMGKRE
ncbi:MAG: hypothetical protein AB1665_06530 [Candidatus Thermoplasmatota archaeon]